MPMSSIREQPIAAAALVVALGSLAAILAAFYFQYVLKYLPCPLCYQQRIPYYVVVPLGLAVAFAAVRGAPRGLLLAGLAVIAAALLLNAGIAVYHSGIEWKWWAGPSDCSGPLTDFGRAGDLMRQLQTINVVRCDEAPWRFLGLSIAGWNFVIALTLALVAIRGLAAGRRG